MGFLRFSLALLSTLVLTAQAQRDLAFHVGAGCAFSNYTTLQAVDASGAGSPPTKGAVLSYRLQLEMGLGSGVYVLHFTQFNLPDDDLVRLQGEGARGGSVILSGSNTTGGFYATPVVGDEVTIELWKTNGAPTSSSSSCRGFEIDGLRFAPQKAAEAAQEKDLAVGLPSVLESATVETTSNSTNPEHNDESICGTDESVEAVCLEAAGTAADLVMYQKARSVARLTIRKNSNIVAFCTGWLLGCEGHLITNQHCIGNWMDALNTGVEFFAEAQTCSAGSSQGTCLTQGSCPGRIAVSSTVLVAVSKELDYALVKLTPDDGSDVSTLLQAVGGYLQLRSTGPKLEETIFIPQHPLGGAKRVAWTVNGKPGRIESLTTDTCGSTDAGYSVDTQDGASGSPVISTTDDTVVALHHCGGCPNGGIPADKLIADFQSKGVLPKCAIAS